MSPSAGLGVAVLFAPSFCPAGRVPELPDGIPACNRPSAAVWMSIFAVTSQATN